MMKISDLKFASPAAETIRKQATALATGTLETLFRTVAHGSAEHAALEDATTTLRFAELDALSAAIARFVTARNYGPEPVVGVVCMRGAPYLAAALGVMRAGAVYLPIEQDLPQVRKEIMLRPARLLITDTHCLRDAEYLRYRNPGIAHILCIDSPEYDTCMERPSALSSTAYWEHLAGPGSDQGWKSLFSGELVADEALQAMAANVLKKSGIATKPRGRVLDIGSGSGIVAQTLAGVAGQYTAVELARNELDRVERLSASASVAMHHMEAVDIGFLQGEPYDGIILNGVVENFPGYAYLRTVLNHAVRRLSDDGVLFVGAVWDLEARDALRDALRNHAQTSGNARGLSSFEASEALFLSRKFFTEWAQESPVPVRVCFSPLAGPDATGRDAQSLNDTEQQHLPGRVDRPDWTDRPDRENRAKPADMTGRVYLTDRADWTELVDYRFDVVITRSPQSTFSRTDKTRFGLNDALSAPDVAFPLCTPEQAAYIVYTSGSTGIPKGIVVEHRNLLHILMALRKFSEGCHRAALVAPLSFDASIQQIAVSLFLGKPLYVMSDEERKNPEAFLRCVHERNIDLCDMTPAFFNVLVEYLHERNLSLPIVRILLAGEILRPDTIQKFYHIAGNEQVVLFNVYGPTECTVDSSAFRIDKDNYKNFSAYPIGTPLEGCVISVRDKNGSPLPDSVTGEIWISGNGVTRGYLDIPEEQDGKNRLNEPESQCRLSRQNTPEKSPFLSEQGTRWYRTGDYGFMVNGLAYYQGREDQQVKIRGNRVEIGEVENAIATFPGVKQVAVVAGTFSTGEDKTLAAYVVGNADIPALRHYLERQLPSYYVPGYYVPMTELPLSANRKVDKKALPSPSARPHTHLEEKEGTPTTRRPPEGPLEEALASMWKRLLGVEVTDTEANFFSLGGHSILAIRLIAMIEKELHAHITVTELFAHPTLALLAHFFAGKAKEQEGPIIKLCHCEGGKKLFLFHPVGGSVFCYSALMEHLRHAYTVYAVEAAGFRPERTALNTELHRVEGLAAYYLEEILKVETDDILFGGWSFGGLLAYETACLYEKTGRKTDSVLILDSVANNSGAKQMAAKDDVEMLKSLLQNTLAFDETTLRSLPRAHRLAYLVECGEKTGLLPAGFSAVQMDNLLQTYRSNAIAAARYERPTRSDKKILLVRALEFSGNVQIVPDDVYQGWSDFLKKSNITLAWTEGTHETMLSPGLAGNVAKHILEYLNNA